MITGSKKTEKQNITEVIWKKIEMKARYAVCIARTRG
jgi:hypothetical protein